jgi:hypothetical protein
MKAAATFLFTSLALACAPATALAEDTAPAILSPTQGATVSSPVTITLSPGSHVNEGGTDAPGMSDMPGMSHMAHGHLHLIVDAPLPAPGATIPMDRHHIHLMHGETSTRVALPQGQHTIQLIAGSAHHTVAPNAAHSAPVTFTVK